MNFFRKKRNDDHNSVQKIADSCEYKDNCPRKHRHRYGRSLAGWEATSKREVTLSECPSGSLCIVSNNPNKMTKEIGLNPGKTIAIFKNEPADSNMIICLDTTRFIVAKSRTRKITVKIVTPENNSE